MVKLIINLKSVITKQYKNKKVGQEWFSQPTLYS